MSLIQADRLAVILVLFCATCLPVASAEGLPSGLAYSAAGFDGSDIYVFGGGQGTAEGAITASDRILKMDPQTGEVKELDVRLPTARASIALAWTGKEFLLFGGSSGETVLGEILRFDPATRTLAKLPAHLDPPRAGLSAVWTGDAVLLFGGMTSCARPCVPASNEILRFDPLTQSVAPEPAALPRGYAEQASYWDGRAAYLFGGIEGSPDVQRPSSAILRYEPGGKVVEEIPLALPSPRVVGHAIASAEGRAYLFGGIGSGGALIDQVLVFDPQVPTLTTVARLPGPRGASSVASAGDAVFLIGGIGCPKLAECSDMLEYDRSDLVLTRHHVSGQKGVPGIPMIAVGIAVGASAALAKPKRRARASAADRA